MGRDAAKSIGNPWRDARLRAAQWNEKLNSREGVGEELNISVDSIRRIETGINKVMPVEHAVLLADEKILRSRQMDRRRHPRCAYD